MLGPYSNRAVSKPFWVAGTEEQDVEIHVQFQAFDPGAELHVSIQTDDGDVIHDFVVTASSPEISYQTSLKPSDPDPPFQFIPPGHREPAKPPIPISANHGGDPSDREPNLLYGYRIVFSFTPGPGRLPMGIHGMYTLRGGPEVTLWPPPRIRPKGPIETSIEPGEPGGIWERIKNLGRSQQPLPASGDWQQHVQTNAMNLEHLQLLHRAAIDSFSQAQQASELLRMHSDATTRQLQESATRFAELGSRGPHVPDFDASVFQRMSEQTERMSRQAQESGERAAEAQTQLGQARWMRPDAASQITNWGERPWLNWDHS
jgi:hypothetical protein